MQRALRNNWTLIGLVAILGAAALADQVRSRLAAPKPLLALDLKSVHEIVLECPDCPRRRLEKIGGRWKMAEPYALPADAAQVDKLLSIAKVNVQHHYSAQTLEADKVGLTPPFARLSLGERKLEFGTTEALRNERYVRVGSEIVLVTDRFSHLLRLTPEALLDKRPTAGLGPIAKASLGGAPLPAATQHQLELMQAERVTPAPANARGRVLALGFADGHELRFELLRYGEEWQLVRLEPALSYVIKSDDANALLQAAATEKGK
jgi:hypothetical protein